MASASCPTKFFMVLFVVLVAGGLQRYLLGISRCYPGIQLPSIALGSHGGLRFISIKCPPVYLDICLGLSYELILAVNYSRLLNLLLCFIASYRMLMVRSGNFLS